MLTIRFARVGKKNKPQFKIMLQEHTIAPGGTHVEVLGSYDPRSKQAVLKEERIKYWVSQGVKISDTAYNLFLKQGVLTGEKRKVKIPAKKVEPASAPATAGKEVPAETATPEVPKTEAKPEEVKVETVETPKVETAIPAAENKKEEEKSKENLPEAEEKKPARPPASMGEALRAGNVAPSAAGGEEAKPKEAKAE